MRTLNLALLSATVAAIALVGGSANAAAERHYDCTKAGNANKAECKAAAATGKPATTPAPAAVAKPAATAAAKPAPAAAKPAPTPTPTPTPAAKPAPTAVAPAKPTRPRAAKPPKGEPGTRSAAQLANDNKMKACGAKWQALSAGDKAKWDAKGGARKDKNGHPETGWIAFSSDCRKG